MYGMIWRTRNKIREIFTARLFKILEKQQIKISCKLNHSMSEVKTASFHDRKKYLLSSKISVIKGRSLHIQETILNQR